MSDFKDKDDPDLCKSLVIDPDEDGFDFREISIKWEAYGKKKGWWPAMEKDMSKSTNKEEKKQNDSAFYYTLWATRNDANKHCQK